MGLKTTADSPGQTASASARWSYPRGNTEDADLHVRSLARRRAKDRSHAQAAWSSCRIRPQSRRDQGHDRTGSCPDSVHSLYCSTTSSFPCSMENLCRTSFPRTQKITSSAMFVAWSAARSRLRLMMIGVQRLLRRVRLARHAFDELSLDRPVQCRQSRCPSRAPIRPSLESPSSRA